MDGGRVCHQDKGIGMDCLVDVDERARRRLWRRMARMLLPRGARRRLHAWFGDLWIARRPDRIYMERDLIPAVARRGGKVLFIGCGNTPSTIQRCLRRTARSAGLLISTRPLRDGALRNGM